MAFRKDSTRPRQQSYELRRYAGVLSRQFCKRRLRRDTWSTDHVQRLDRLCANESLRPSMLPKNSSDTGVESPSIVNLVSTSLATRASVPISSVELLDTYKRKPHRIQSRYFEIFDLIYVVCMAGLNSSEARNGYASTFRCCE